MIYYVRAVCYPNMQTILGIIASAEVTVLDVT